MNQYWIVVVNCAITAFLFGDWLHTRNPFIGGVFFFTLLLTLQMILKDVTKAMRRDN